MNPDDENNTGMSDDNRPHWGTRHPPKFETPEEMQEQISAYFNGGMKKRQIIVGKANDKKVIEVPVPTITGLCLFLGFDSRQSFYDYEKNELFSYTIKKARTFIELEYEEILATTGNAGAIFALKNFGWKDKTELELSGKYEDTREKLRDFYDDRGGLQDDGETADTPGSSDA